MSKDKPEVGDVWEDEGKNIRIFIIGIDKYNGSFRCCVQDIDANYYYTQVFYFMKKCKYLGKSKVNISDLFKTESE